MMLIWLMLLCEIILWLVLVIHFSKGFRYFLNIHSIVISLIVLYSLPSTILMLQDKITMNNAEILILFSTIYIGLIGYTFGVLFFKRLFFFKKRKIAKLSKIINALFWLTYKYRYVLLFIICIVLFHWGFMPRGMSYRQSVTYRMETPGVIQYFNLLIPYVFSVLMVAMISIVGDLKKYKKLSWLSYLFIILVVLSIIGGHRIWIIALFACLMISFQPYLKRRHNLLIVIPVAIMILVISGGVRYARVGESFTENTNRFYEYFLNIKNMTFTDLMWRWGMNSITASFSTYITLIKNIPQNIKYDYSAYIKDFSLLIPTIIYPERPLPYNKWYVKTFEPEIFQRGGGKTFYVLGFGYLFAGPVGVLIHLFLCGILFEFLNKFFKMIGGAAGVFLYSYFFIELFRFVVGYGFIAFIKVNLILNFFIPITLLFLFTLIFNLLIFGKFKF